jgi:hypothetical protein
MDIAEIREAVGALPRFRNGKIRRVPDLLRSAILEQASQCEGTRSDFAKLVGLSASVVDSWVKRKLPKPGKLRRVRIVEDGVVPTSSGWTLDGPRGLRVSGMTIAHLAELFRQLEGR